MLEVIIALACIALIVAYAEHLVVGAILLAYAAIFVLFAAICIFVIIAALNLIEQIFPILIFFSLIWLAYISIRNWQKLSNFSRQLFSNIIRSICSTVNWSPKGIFFVATWMFFLPSIAAAIIFGIFGDNFDEQGQWSLSVRMIVVIPFLGSIFGSILLFLFGWAWITANWLRRPGKKTS